MSEGEHEHSYVVSQRDADRLKSDLGMHDGDEFVSWTVARDVECGDRDPKVALEVGLCTEGQLPNL